MIYERLLRCQKYCQIMITTIQVDSHNALPLLTMRYGYALVNSSHIAYCTLAYCVYAYCLDSGHFQPPHIFAFSLFGAKSSKGLVSGSSHSNSSGGKQSTIHLNSPLPVSPSLFMINLRKTWTINNILIFK